MVGTQKNRLGKNRLAEAVLTCTHNQGFDENIKNIFSFFFFDEIFNF